MSEQHPSVRAALQRLPESSDMLHHRHCCLTPHATLCGHHIPAVNHPTDMECVVCADLNHNPDWCPLAARCRQ